MTTNVQPRAAVDLGQAQRQSLWAVAFLALRTLRQIGVIQLVLIVGFVVARLPSVAALMGLVLIVGIALFLIAALQWWRYTFAVVGDELIVRRGVLQQQTLTMPLDRIQSVSLEQKLLHRLVSLVQVELDTAGTQTAEFVIDAIDRNVAQALQRSVANHRAHLAATAGDQGERQILPAPPERVVVHHDARRVTKIALTQMPFAGLVLVAPLLAAGDEVGRFINWLPLDFPTIDEPTVGWWLAWFVPLAVIVGLVVSVALNIVRVFLSHWNLTVVSTAAGLRRDAGLLSTTSVAATIPRVQLVRTHQGPLARLASLRSVEMATIGKVELQVPGCTEEQATLLRELVLPGVDGDGWLRERVSSQEIFLNTRNTLVVTAVLAAALWFAVGWWSLLVLLLTAVAWGTTRRSVRLRRWGMTADALADRQQLVGWDRRELLLRKINGVTVRQSLFERKRDLATVTFATAAGAISIGMISLAQATEIRDRALFAVETDHRSWM